MLLTMSVLLYCNMKQKKELYDLFQLLHFDRCTVLVVEQEFYCVCFNCNINWFVVYFQP